MYRCYWMRSVAFVVFEGEHGRDSLTSLISNIAYILLCNHICLILFDIIILLQGILLPLIDMNT